MTVWSEFEIDEREKRMLDLIIKENHSWVRDIYHYI